MNAPSRKAVLEAGLRWLFDTCQPDDAILHHGGSPIFPADDGRTYRFVPAGPGGKPVIVVNVGHPQREQRRGRHGAEWVLTNPLAPNELAEISAVLQELGRKVWHTWNGHPSQTGSVALEKQAHTSLRSCVYRYSQGCPTHRTVFCARDKACRWYATGHAKIVPVPITASSEVSV
jgi:hypothetical protein